MSLKNEIYSSEFQNKVKLAIFDELGNQRLNPKLLINGSIVKDTHHYIGQNSHTERYFGTKYCILRTEFLDYRNKTQINSSIRKILLTFGGSDDHDVLRQILPFLKGYNFKITVVLGPSYNFKNSLMKIIKNSDIVVKDSIQNMASILAKQDLVISTSGITSYELACLGTPTIFIPATSAQLKNSKNFQKLGFGLNFNFWNNDIEKLSKFLDKISDLKLRTNMSKMGKKLLDGYGSSRVIKLLEQLHSK